MSVFIGNMDMLAFYILLGYICSNQEINACFSNEFLKLTRFRLLLSLNTTQSLFVEID